MHRSIRILLLTTTVFGLIASGCDDGTGDPVDASTDGEAPMIDGGGSDGGVPGGDGPTITICPGDALPSTEEVCTVSAGSAQLLITGDVLTPGEVLRGGQVLLDADGNISCVSCDCSGQSGASAATTVVCPDGVISPGLINAHEHITFQGDPANASAERYEHRHDWRGGDNGHTRVSSGGSARREQIQWDELRMVMSGVTSVNGSGSSDGLVRNLDRSGQEGLGQAQVEYSTFPLGDGRSRTQLTSGCGYDSLPSATRVAREDAYVPHIAEGIGQSARNEFLCVREDMSDIIEANVGLIHGIGLLPPDIQEMADSGTLLVWSPRSNISLYGDTARVTEYDNQGVLIALGTDWQRSGSMNMLRELQCAEGLNQDYFGRHFSDEDLWLMATRNGAIVTATDDVIGTLAVGQVADIAIYDGRMNVDHRAILDARAQDVALVLRGGRVLFGESASVGALPGGADCESLDVCGSARSACVQGELGMSLSALQGENSGGYPLFFCDSDPNNEPSCHPARNAEGSLPTPEVDGSNRYDGMLSSADTDGDGIANEMDNCPSVFNPIRPLDMGAQADFDNDDVGDSCDPCPLDAGTVTCTTANPNDRDRDTVDDGIDNCPSIPNMDQADADEDGKGDLCDACPTAANPGSSLCPATIYQVKGGDISVGAQVQFNRVVVMAAGESGLFLQVPTDDPAYTNEDNSGIFVFTGAPPTLPDSTPITRDMTLDVAGTVGEFSGQIQFQDATFAASAESGAIPAAVTVAAADVDTGGSRASALEAVLITIADAQVTDAAPAPTGTDDGIGEFEVAGPLRVDNVLFTIEPFATEGETFNSITGMLMLRQARHKLMPRDAADVVAGPPVLTGFGPARTYTREGGTAGPTFPEALSVQVSRASSSEIVVTLVSSDMTGLPVASTVTIAAGETSAAVDVTGITGGTYTLTATLDTASLMAEVVVLGAADVPTSFTLTPSAVEVGAGNAQTFTLTLDLPSAGETVIDLADTSGGTVAATATIGADMQSVTFEYVAPEAEGSGELTASVTLVGTLVSQVAAITVLPPASDRLVINEVDYDQPVTDTAEFIELYNPSGVPVDLTTLQLILFNGNGGTIYNTIDLSDAGSTLAPGAYLVVRAPGLSVAADTLTIDFGSAEHNVQNGRPDGMAVWNTAEMHLVDVLSYEGSMESVTIDGVNVSLVEGRPTDAEDRGDGSLSRIPNGNDTDIADVDWMCALNSTPGAANDATPCP